MIVWNFEILTIFYVLESANSLIALSGSLKLGLSSRVKNQGCPGIDSQKRQNRVFAVYW